MGIITKGLILVTIGVVLVGSYNSYEENLISWIKNEPLTESLDNQSINYLASVDFLRKNSEIVVLKTSWDEYKTMLDKIDKMWYVNIQYVSWEEFVEYEAGKPEEFKRFYDPSSERIWVENIFVGSSIRVIVYEYN